MLFKFWQTTTNSSTFGSNNKKNWKYEKDCIILIIYFQAKWLALKFQTGRPFSQLSWSCHHLIFHIYVKKSSWECVVSVSSELNLRCNSPGTNFIWSCLCSEFAVNLHCYSIQPFSLILPALDTIKQPSTSFNNLNWIRGSCLPFVGSQWR